MGFCKSRKLISSFHELNPGDSCNSRNKFFFCITLTYKT